MISYARVAGQMIDIRSLVMANSYAITDDSSVYTDPDKFNPDGYIPISENGAGESLLVDHLGFGRW